MKNKLIYLTYQSFPSFKANTLQTIDNLNYLSKYFEIELIFPLREKNSSDDMSVLKNYYYIDKNIKVQGVVHNYPFGKIKMFENLLFIISHFLWSKKIVKKIERENVNYFFTRSDWVFYFLARKNKRVVFECHQLSKIRKFVMKKSIEYQHSRIIFLNNLLKADSGINSKKFEDKLIVLHNGVDSNLFKSNTVKDRKRIIFIGNLKRFGENRNLDFYISTFKNKNMPVDFKFTIIGTPKAEVDRLNSYIKKAGLENNVEAKNWVKREEAIEALNKSSIGLLINTKNNNHSVKYTSPLKYFEYIYGKLKVVATNYPAHNDLPFSNRICFFENEDVESFIESLKKADQEDPLSREELESLTLKKRSEKIFNFIK
tara:strand:- start:1256 stop:2371 length:1116 start_codon:yes stop_codon:yes gene_type:complete